MLQQIFFHPAGTREFKDFGFMQAHLSFKPHLPEGRRRFGPLITIDDGTLTPGATGFGLHPHRDVEVVTFLVSGQVNHVDPNVPDHDGVLEAKGIQVITAGTGIVHNEMNASTTEPMRAMQIWFEPRAKGLAPAYSRKALEAAEYTDRLQLVLSSDGTDGSLIVEQDVRLSYGQFSEVMSLTYRPSAHGRSLYVFMVEGAAEVADQALGQGDALGVTDAGDLLLNAKPGAELLIFDLPPTSN
ncbi:pirin family protein [Ruegeria sediminis]|nr:pirin family protein [Ruegeria sediminis]